MGTSVFLRSSVGQKVIVAVTGLFMVLFLIVHLLGNLEVFQGPDHINQYSKMLHAVPQYLWVLRIAMIVSLVLHVWFTIRLTRINRALKPAYHVSSVRKASITSRTMMWSGLTVLAFVFYHLAHYTFGIVNPEIVSMVDGEGRPHVYNMMVMGFSTPLVSGFYILSIALLAGHLNHGVASAARTLGCSSGPTYERIRLFGRGFAALIALGYISIPLAVLTGFLPLDL
jgi:succinate dehydrogenase / fumarate reductase cytochrome b subunit